MEGVNAYMSERARIYIKACWGASVGGKSCHPEKDPGHIVFRPLSACRSRDMIPIAIQNSKHQSLPPLLLPDVARTGPASMHTFYDNFRDPFRGAGGPGGGGVGVGVTLRGGGTSLGGGLGADLGAGRHPGRLLLNDPLPRAPPVLPGAAAGGLESLARLAAVSSDSYMVRPAPLAAPVAMAGVALPNAPTVARAVPAVTRAPDVPAVPAVRTPPAAGPVTARSPLARRARSPCSPRAARAAPSAKRQRIGPSCDSCRLKKIKCDASVEVLFQDEALVAFNGNRHESLHVAMTPAEARAALPSHVWDALPPHIVDALEAQDARRGEVVRHVDKVVFFRACASCTRRTAVGSGGKETDSDSGAASTPAAGPGSAPASPAVDSEGKADARSEPCCSFSKGFTRSDINVFTRLQKQLGARGQLADFTVADYRAIGY
ncbi:Sut1p [Lachancea thermotolerans CBS 6340]|uniref:KLTH0G17050p n=1 Tax=Lachancea thermotolerans (strain ATCC 56472 / CBS 6340 / NRRL Y-8284) TaxID=559295 RepID=C5DNH4_LACTC|nr:KLTH0G17050p [Lachancea thermotolerans CBS 6340]CAR25335.1 KLTH0G17050p [Lachancea thermotolerans CBS 6340]